jgi:hypothetical protein
MIEATQNQALNNGERQSAEKTGDNSIKLESADGRTANVRCNIPHE